MITLGVNYTWNPESRGLLFIIPTFSAMLLGLWHWLNQYALNETIYQAAAARSVVSTTAPTGGK